MTKRERMIIEGKSIAPKTADEKALAAALDSIESAVELPVVTAEDNGDLLGVSSGKWAKVAAPSAAPYEVAGTVDAETGAMTLSDITAAGLYAVAQTGRMIQFVFDVSGADVVVISGITAQDINGSYDFSLIAANGAIYASGHLEGTDAVVLTPAAASEGG